MDEKTLNLISRIVAKQKRQSEAMDNLRDEYGIDLESFEIDILDEVLGFMDLTRDDIGDGFYTEYHHIESNVDAVSSFILHMENLIKSKATK